MDSIRRPPISFTSSGVMVFTVACVPTGIKTGVSTLPWGVSSSPSLALDFESFSSSLKIIAIMFLFLTFSQISSMASPKLKKR